MLSQEEQEGRVILKKMQLMVHNKKGVEALEVAARVREYADSVLGESSVAPEEEGAQDEGKGADDETDEEPKRKSKRGRDRRERGGRNRER